MRPLLALAALSLLACAQTATGPAPEPEPDPDEEPVPVRTAPPRVDAGVERDAAAVPAADSAASADAAMVAADAPPQPPPNPACPAVPERPFGVVLESSGPFANGRPGDKVYTLAVAGTDIGQPKLMCGLDVRLFVPGDVPRLRGALVSPSSTQAGPGGAPEEVMRALGFGKVSLKLRLEDGENQVSRAPVLARGMLFALARIAAHARRPEIEHLPFVLTGQSRGGAWSRDIANQMPARTIAYANVSGWLILQKDEAQRAVPAAYIVGSETDPKEPWKMLVDVVTDYFPARQAGLPWTAAIMWGQNEHGSDNENTFVLPYFEALVRARLPDDADTTRGPVSLRPVDVASGWLGDRNGWTFTSTMAANGEPEVSQVTISAAHAHFAPIAPFATYPGEKAAAVWLPDRRTANVWRAFMAQEPPFTLRATTDGASLPASGFRRLVVAKTAAVTLEVAGTGLTSVQFFDGDIALGPPLTAAPWRATWTPGAAGAHPVFAVWKDGSGRMGTTHPALIVAR